MSVLKYVGLAVGALCVLLLMVVTGVALFFDPNDHKARLHQLVEQRTGRTLQIPGRLELSWFPWLAVELGPASLGNAPGFGASPMLEIGRARLGLRLSGLLLRRRLELDTLRLDRPVVRLAIDAEGRDNWTDVVDRLAAEPAAGGTADGGSLEVTFADLQVEAGRFQLTDARDDSRVELLDLRVATGRLRAAQPFDLQAGFTWRTDAALAIATDVQGQASWDPQARRFRLDAPRIGLRLRGEDLPADGLPVEIGGGPFEFDLAAQTLALRALRVESLGARLEGELAGRRMIDDPSVTGRVRLAQFSPRDWLTRAGLGAPRTRDPAALAALSLEGQLLATPRRIELEDATLRLDESTARGRLGIADLDAEHWPLRFELAVDRLDLDRYLAPEAGAGAAPASATTTTTTSAGAAPTAPAPADAEAFRLPVETLRTADVIGVLELARGQVAGMPVTALNLGVNAQAARLRLFPLEATLFGGRYRGDLRVDVTGDEPRLEFDEALAGIELGPLLGSLFDARRFTGRGTGTLQGRARGIEVDDWLRTATGSVRVDVAEGAIEGGDLWYEIRRARALLRGEPLPARPAGTPRTAFTRLQASGRLGDGALRSDDLAMDLQYLRVAGRGRLDLVSNALDWTLDTKVLRIPDEDAASRELVDLAVPVRVTGTLADPSIRPDLAGLARARVREELEKRRPELERKKQELQDKLRDRLQDLFKR